MTIDLTCRLARPLAGFCAHGQVVGLTIDATSDHLSDFLRSYASVASVADPPAPIDWCDVCVGGAA